MLHASMGAFKGEEGVMGKKGLCGRRGYGEEGVRGSCLVTSNVILNYSAMNAISYVLPKV